MSTHTLDALSRLLFAALLLLVVCTLIHANVVPLTDEQLREYEVFANEPYAYEQRFPAAKRELKGSFFFVFKPVRRYSWMLLKTIKYHRRLDLEPAAGMHKLNAMMRALVNLRRYR